MSKAGASLATCYGPVRADVDGVLSDGLIYMGNNGEELKAFNVRDGYGIRCALTSDIEVAIITGRKAKLVEDRCATLGITHLYQGQSNKLIAFSDLLEKLAIAPENVAYVGDDLIDWPVMEKVRDAGIKVCSGGIVGLGETVKDRAGLLLQLANLPTPPESVPINMLVKVKGTPLADNDDVDAFDFIRTIAVARIMMPTSYVRLSAGREQMNEQTQAMCFMASTVANC